MSEAGPPMNAIWRPSDVRPLQSDSFQLFALSGSETLGQEMARSLSRPLAGHEERSFEDGEHKVRPLEIVAGKDVYIVHSLHGGPDQSPNDKLCRLLFFLAALKDAGAARTTAVVPYLCYARKDRRTKLADPLTIRYVARLFETTGIDAVVVLEVHNDAAFESAFRPRTIALTAAPLLIERIVELCGDEKLCVVSPDLGGGKRADLLHDALETKVGRSVGKAFVEKHRSGGVVSGDLFAGDVENATCIIVDDLISTGGTLVRAARAARARGARKIIACVAHGLFMPGAEQALSDPAIDRIVVADAVPPFRLPPGAVRDKLDLVPAAPLLAEAVRRLHLNESLADLLVF